METGRKTVHPTETTIRHYTICNNPVTKPNFEKKQIQNRFE